MILPAMLMALAPAPAALPDNPLEDRYNRCLAQAASDPAAAETEAGRWLLSGGGFFAHQCLGIAYTHENKMKAAAAEFELAARGAETAKDRRAAYYWAQSGNAWLAAMDSQRARAALDAALAPGTLTGLERGEAYLDRARAFFASGDQAAARTDLDHALSDAADDPLVWLLSATLARTTGDLSRATKDIAEALKRASDDPSVQLEAGNIAALAGDETGAKGAWSRAAALQPGSAASTAAANALAQFDSPAPQ